MAESALAESNGKYTQQVLATMQQVARDVLKDELAQLAKSGLLAEENCTIPGAAAGKCGCHGTGTAASTGKACSCSAGRGVELFGRPVTDGQLQDFLSVWNGLGPECAIRCRKQDPCILWYWCMMTSRYSAYRMVNIMRLDDDIIPLNVFAGDAAAAPPFIDIFNNPLTTGQKTLIRTTSAQQGPFRPGCLKVTPRWLNGVDRNDALTIQWFVGPRDLVDLNEADIASLLVRAGSAKALADYTTNNDCCLMPWPDWMNCEPPPIPDTEAIYAYLQMGNVGAAQLTGLNISVVKANTKECDRCMKCCS
ncbi:hypothetical protein [Nannocystis exedens]|uniref:hypothetical protein n=1 Tax=Nannocystis exedens TaxID=54 RepID=UPI000BBA02F0|nr:hypothetical protein [Nannocystis exedens]PCC66473.1 hypothetical protein NAEX_09061 [Nannocystis exedens]